MGRYCEPSTTSLFGGPVASTTDLERSIRTAFRPRSRVLPAGPWRGRQI